MKEIRLSHEDVGERTGRTEEAPGAPAAPAKPALVTVMSVPVSLILLTAMPLPMGAMTSMG